MDSKSKAGKEFKKIAARLMGETWQSRSNC